MCQGVAPWCECTCVGRRCKRAWRPRAQFPACRSVALVVHAYSGQSMDSLRDASVFVANPTRRGDGPGGASRPRPRSLVRRLRPAVTARATSPRRLHPFLLSTAAGSLSRGGHDSRVGGKCREGGSHAKRGGVCVVCDASGGRDARRRLERGRALVAVSRGRNTGRARLTRERRSVGRPVRPSVPPSLRPSVPPSTVLLSG